MALVVQKYGGSSVAVGRPHRAGGRAHRAHRQGRATTWSSSSSAMGDTTDELTDLATQVHPSPPPREMDMLLTSGERISNALLAMAINAQGGRARSFSGSQAGMITTAKHGDARIVDVTPGRIHAALAEGAHRARRRVPGRQRRTPRTITTLGRGGSDTTAVALAAAHEGRRLRDLHRRRRRVHRRPADRPERRSCSRPITYEEMLEMAACGAKVLHLRAVEYARRVRRAAARALVVQRQARHHGRRVDRGASAWSRPSSPASRTTAPRRRSRSSACPTAGLRGAHLPRGRRRRDQHRHDGAERVAPERRARPTSPFTLPSPDGPKACRRAVRGAGRGRLRGACSTTSTSAR